MKYRISKKGCIFVSFDFVELCALHDMLVFYFDSHCDVNLNLIPHKFELTHMPVNKRVIDFIDIIFCDYCLKNEFLINDFCSYAFTKLSKTSKGI